MKYTKVYIDAIGYEIAPVVVSSLEIERRLSDLYSELHLSEGQLEALTGIVERRWWEDGHLLSDGAIAAANHALEASSVGAKQLEALIYGSVCREHFEPATACRVAAGIGVGPESAVHDVSNACLGVLNGIIDIANRIELGQIRAGMVVGCETSREINEIVIEQILRNRSMDFFKQSLATLTGGSGAVAVLLTDGSFSASKGRKLLGGVWRTAPQFHGLCRWGIEPDHRGDFRRFQQFTRTDSSAVLANGVELGLQTWKAFLKQLEWPLDRVEQGHHPPGRLIAPRLDPEIAGHPGLERFLDLSLPREHGHCGLADDRRAGRRTRVSRARRPRRLPGDRQRAELHDARPGVVARRTEPPRR